MFPPPRTRINGKMFCSLKPGGSRGSLRSPGPGRSDRPPRGQRGQEPRLRRGRGHTAKTAPCRPGTPHRPGHLQRPHGSQRRPGTGPNAASAPRRPRSAAPAACPDRLRPARRGLSPQPLPSAQPLAPEPSGTDLPGCAPCAARGPAWRRNPRARSGPGRPARRPPPGSWPPCLPRRGHRGRSRSGPAPARRAPLAATRRGAGCRAAPCSPRGGTAPAPPAALRRTRLPAGAAPRRGRSSRRVLSAYGLACKNKGDFGRFVSKYSQASLQLHKLRIHCRQPLRGLLKMVCFWGIVSTRSPFSASWFCRTCREGKKQSQT